MICILHRFIFYCICGWDRKFCSQSMISEHIQWFLDLCLLLMQCCQRTQRSQASNIDFQPCPLNMISLDSQNLLIVCTVDEHYSEVLQQDTVIWKLVNRCPSSLLRKSASLRSTFYIALWIKYRFMRFIIIPFWFYLHFIKCANVFWNWFFCFFK